MLRVPPVPLLAQPQAERRGKPQLPRLSPTPRDERRDGDLVTGTKELGKRLSKAVAQETEQPDTEALGGAPKPAAPPETPETPAPAESPETPEPKPTATPSPEQTQRKFERAVSAFRAKLCEVFEVEDLEPTATPGVVGFLLPGFFEKRTHDDFTRCATCNGWGKVLTGSLKPGDDEHDCPDPRCAGRGYWQKAVEPKPTVQTMVPMPTVQPNGGGDQWDRPSWLGDPRLSSAAT